MRVIELNTANLDKIHETTGFSRNILEEMNAPEARNPGQTLYFSDDFQADGKKPRVVLFPGELLDKEYNYDPTNIATEFVEYTLKTMFEYEFGDEPELARKWLTDGYKAPEQMQMAQEFLDAKYDGK